VIIATTPLVRPPAAVAAEHYRYFAAYAGHSTYETQKELDKRAAEGWELVAPVASDQISGLILIFRKEEQ
jgi:hypothetical protein